MTSDLFERAQRLKEGFDRAADAKLSREREAAKEAGSGTRPASQRHEPKPGMALQPRGPIREAQDRETFAERQAKEALHARAQNLARQLAAEKEASEKVSPEKAKDERER